MWFVDNGFKRIDQSTSSINLIDLLTDYVLDEDAEEEEKKDKATA
jgi:hypothetical protein